MGQETKNSQLQLRVSEREKAAIRRAAQLAGLDVSSWVLSKITPPQLATRFRELVVELRRAKDPGYCLAEINSLLTKCNRAEFSETVRDCDWSVLSPFLANYLAAMVETSAHKKHFSPPDWTHEILPSTAPYLASQLISLRTYLLVNSPPAFRRRNIFIDATIGDQV